ncbi:uncharacterized protein LOC143177201 [Calliopsis andreniformis]|uniref:uncharacterized protein LOC143177201 n=1 Tax=Calliopsis andreniformis TaxID=337506 RepID=UPI003FCDC414
MMLRGHVGSVELIRGVCNPFFRRNLSAASIRYADEKDKKKADGIFSWLKDIFKSDAQKSNLTGHETVLSTPPDSLSSAGHGHGADAIDKEDDLKKLTDRDKGSAPRVETIQPDSNPSLHGVSGNIPKNLREDEPSDLVQRPKPENVSLDERRKEEESREESIHAIRQAQLLSVTKQEIEQIYELKNYAYLRPEEMKHLRFNVQSNPGARDPEESPSS